MYKIYISTFGAKCLRVRHGIPIEVGAIRRNNFIYSVRDDVGDNISFENDYYGELSGLYWIWKNVELADYDIIGFCHYNKCLNISKFKAQRWLFNNPNGFIVLKPIFAKPHEAKDEIDAIVESLKESEKDVNAWFQLYNESAASKTNNCYSCNMFISTGKSFKDFCSWLFPILSKMRQIVGDKPDVELSNRRYCAFMGERLLSVYLLSRELPIYCVKRRIKAWWIPLIYPVIKKMNFNKENKWYRCLGDLFGSSSSYKKYS